MPCEHKNPPLVIRNLKLEPKVDVSAYSTTLLTNRFDEQFNNSVGDQTFENIDNININMTEVNSQQEQLLGTSRDSRVSKLCYR